MNKKELAGSIAERTGVSKAKAAEVVAAIFGDTGILSQSLQNGEKVSIQGFGTFESKERAARAGVNPATGKKIDVPAKKVVKFKAGSALADLVSGS